MHISSRSSRTIAWTSLMISAVSAQNIIDYLSFGDKDGVYISPDLRHIPHFTTRGSDDFNPQILSDRVILTPPYPGARRGAIWGQDPMHHGGDWTAQLDFRVSGMDRGQGNLQFWYVKESQAHDTPASLYTAPKFDGLVLVVDQYEGRGGSIRGFLNDGNVDIKSHPDPDTLAFGKCDYAYRNRGILSSIKMHHKEGLFEVTVDDHPCFKTDKVKLPDGYYFGVSASSGENPDAFEVHKLIVSSSISHARDEPIHINQQAHHQQQVHATQAGHEQQTHKQGHIETPQTQIHDIPKMLGDVLAGSIRSQADQFADLHDRLQNLNHRVEALHEILARMHTDSEQRFNSLMNRVVPADDRSAAIMRNVEKVERTSMSILRDLESKDFKDMLNQVHRAIENTEEGLSRSLPIAMNRVYGSHKPSMTTFLFVAIAVQIMVTGAYLVYKNRRKSAPKKYL